MRFPNKSSPPSSSPTPLTVSEIVDRIKSAVRINVGSQWVQGEISNLRIQASGHAYFTLKDASAQIACVLFKQRSQGCTMALKDGLKVRVYGEATIYEQRGQVQLVLSAVEAMGSGDLYAQFMALKAKLEAEGLFDSARKKVIPSHPASIGIITSPTGAAMQDIRHVLEKRAPWVRVYLMPVLVQGNESAAQITSAIRRWSTPEENGLPQVDVIIIARGGGSIEDLWSFNDELLARSIHDCPTPIISGVGHETDFTIADFVSDLRAPTPSAAAMAATPDRAELSNQVSQYAKTLRQYMGHALTHARQAVQFCLRSKLFDPAALIASFQQQLDLTHNDLIDAAQHTVSVQSQYIERLSLSLRSRHPRMLNQERQHTLARVTEKFAHTNRHRLSADRNQLAILAARLQSVNPVHTLERGYSIVKNSQGELIRSPEQTTSGDALTITTAHGPIAAHAD